MACHSILMQISAISDLLGRFHGRMVIPNPYPSPPSMCNDPTENRPRCRRRWVKMLVFLSLPIAPPLLSSRGDLSGCPHGGIWDMLYIYIVILVWGCQKIAISSPPPPQKKKVDPSFRCHQVTCRARFGLHDLLPFDPNLEPPAGLQRRFGRWLSRCEKKKI